MPAPIHKRSNTCTRRAFLAATAGLVGCGKSSKTKSSSQVLRYAIALEPATLDPACIIETPSLELLQNVYEGLVTFDENNRVVPQLAEHLDISPDGLVYTFYLRSGVKFHNGRQMSASDVKFSLERALWHETKSGVASNYLGGIVGLQDVVSGKSRELDGVKVVDPQTVTVTLDRPRGYFLGALAYPTSWIVCREAIERNGGRLDENAAIGTGPFRFAEYRHSYKFVLTCNRDHYAGRPPLDRIERPIVKDPQTVHIMYENGELDICTLTPGDFLNDSRNPKLKSEIRVVPSADVDFLVMHPDLEPAFRNVKARQAIARAVDRKEIAEVASHGIWTAEFGFLPPGFPGYNEGLNPHQFNPEYARSLLAGAGYPGGRSFPKLTLVYPKSSNEISAMAQVIRKNLNENLRLPVDLQERDAAVLRTDLYQSRVAFCINDWAPDYIDPQNYLSMLLHSKASLNFFGYRNAKFDALCDRADAESDMAKRIPLYQEADRLAMEEVALLPLVCGSGRILVKPYVKGLRRNLMSYLLHSLTHLER